MPEKIWMTFQILRALDELHDHDLYHGNLSPRSVFVNETGWIVLSDLDAVGLHRLSLHDPHNYPFRAIDVEGGQTRDMIALRYNFCRSHKTPYSRIVYFIFAGIFPRQDFLSQDLTSLDDVTQDLEMKSVVELIRACMTEKATPKTILELWLLFSTYLI